MGEAKRRGTYEERVSQAINQGRKKRYSYLDKKQLKNNPSLGLFEVLALSMGFSKIKKH